jgi:hypothetical protein
MDSISKETHAMQIIYTRKYFWEANMPSGFLEDFKNRPLWTASYGQNTGEVPPSPPYPMMPDIWTEWAMWQYTEKCNDPRLLEGVSSKQLDQNLMQDSFYNALRVRSGIPAPAEVDPPVDPTPEPDPTPDPEPTPDPGPEPTEEEILGYLKIYKPKE